MDATRGKVFILSKNQQNSNNSGICTWYVYQVNKYTEQKAKLLEMLRNPENVIIQLGTMCITTILLCILVHMYSKLLVVPKQFLGIYFITKPKFAQWTNREKAQKYRQKMIVSIYAFMKWTQQTGKLKIYIVYLKN